MRMVWCLNRGGRWTTKGSMTSGYRGAAARWQGWRTHSSICRKTAGSKSVSARTGVVRRSQAHAIGVFGGITVICTTERPGMASRADVRPAGGADDDRRLLGRWRRPGRPRQPGHINVLLSSVDFGPLSAQTLGQIANSLNGCENTVSMAMRADSRTIRNRRRAGRFRTMGGVTAGPGIRRWRGTDGHGAEEVGRPGGRQATAMSVSISRIRPMLVARSALSGIAGHYSGHPLRTLFRPCGLRRHCSRAVPLSVEPLSRRCGGLPFSAGGTVALEGPPIVSVGVSLDPRCSVG